MHQLTAPANHVLLMFLVLPVVLVLTSGCDAPVTTKPVGVPEDFARLVGVRDPNAPNKTLLRWLGQYDPLAVPVTIGEMSLDGLRSTTTWLDCTGYIFDPKLIEAVKCAPRLRWLRVGHRATAEDLAWICALEQLRGLSLRNADLREADFHLFGKLTNLEWLDLGGTQIPHNGINALPSLSWLEVLILDGKHVADDDLPDMGQFPKLRVLSLVSSSITDNGLEKVARANPELRCLHLFQASSITDASIVHLAKLRQLEYLHVGCTPLEGKLVADNERGLHDLQRQLPKCCIGIGD